MPVAAKIRPGMNPSSQLPRRRENWAGGKLAPCCYQGVPLLIMNDEIDERAAIMDRTLEPVDKYGED